MAHSRGQSRDRAQRIGVSEMHHTSDELRSHKAAVIKAMQVGREYTYGDLETLTGLPLNAVKRAAGAMREMGILHGERIGDLATFRLNMG